MKNSRHQVNKIRIKSTDGASLVEYGITMGLIGALSVSIVLSLGGSVEDVFSETSVVLASSRSGSVAAGPVLSPPAVPADTNCYNPANLQKVGEAGWTGCEGMYIVASADIDSMKPNNYSIVGPDGETYSFDDNGKNVFTG